jgi:hypothetical protein
VAQFGTADKPILIGSVAIGALLLAGGIGLIARARRTLGLALLGALAFTSVGAAPAAPHEHRGGPAAPGSPRRCSECWPPAGSSGSSTSGGRVIATRRRGRMPAPRHPATAVAIVGGSCSPRPGWERSPPPAAPWGKVLSRGASPSSVALPVAAEALPTLPGGLESTVRGISAFRTPNAQFYRIDTALVIPRVSTDGWSLTIDGDVERPYTITYDELLAMPMGRARHHLDLRVQRGRRPVHRRRPVARRAHQGPARAGWCAGREPTRSSATPPRA